jgi:hypothetical protein
MAKSKDKWIFPKLWKASGWKVTMRTREIAKAYHADTVEGFKKGF